MTEDDIHNRELTRHLDEKYGGPAELSPAVLERRRALMAEKQRSVVADIDREARNVVAAAHFIRKNEHLPAAAIKRTLIEVYQLSREGRNRAVAMWMDMQ